MTEEEAKTSRQEYLKALHDKKCRDRFVGLNPTAEQLFAYDRLVKHWEQSPDECSFLVGDASCIMLKFGKGLEGIWIGIEKDGYAHS